MKKKLNLCIHGHFYQPPRENAWTEEVELQSSASPFHDWNERINHECYMPNTMSRVFDDKGFITNIVNNFERINFNFGPTLLSWMQKKDPGTYNRILEADKTSLELHGGHGNAIAQVYNHIIMPLANKRDKITQVKWGIEDFRKRFNRFPESIWLSETACNEETLEVLVEEGMKYVILEPHQAEAVRKINEDKWNDVSAGSINPKEPYRCFLQNNPDKFIDIFFYDGPISKAVSFEDLLSDAKHFMGKLQSAAVSDCNDDQLISIATDGETYGHHKAFGDRALAYLTLIEASKKGFSITNYGEYLEKHPPKYVVKLKRGENEEGTSWSCAHGVKRWKEHCGCRGDGPAEWNQHWRKPLREALDFLRDRLVGFYEECGSKYFHDVWETRNNYVSILLDRSEENVISFLKTFAKHELNEDEVIICLKLLEMQRNAMLMYTSCAWFFTELSGIETVQVIQYAARALELARSISEKLGIDMKSTEEEFLNLLANTKSNIAECRDGRRIYETYVLPSKTTLEKVAAHYAIYSMFDDENINFDMDCFKINILHHRKETHGSLSVNYGRMKISSKVTLEHQDYVFIVFQFGGYDFRCSIVESDKIEDLEKVENDLFDGLYKSNVVDLLRYMDEYFGKEYYSLRNLFTAERIKLISILSKDAIEKLASIYENAYEENRRVYEVYKQVDLPVPEEISFATEFVLNRKIKSEISRVAESGFDVKKAAPLFKLFEMAKDSKIQLKMDEISTQFSQELNNRVKALRYDPKEEIITECLNIIKIAKKCETDLDIGSMQVVMFNSIKSIELGKLDKTIINGLQKLAKALYIKFEFNSSLGTLEKTEQVGELA